MDSVAQRAGKAARSRAALPMIENRNADFFALSARLLVMPEPGKTMTPKGTIEHPVVALERSGLAVAMKQPSGRPLCSSRSAGGQSHNARSSEQPINAHVQAIGDLRQPVYIQAFEP